MFTGIIEDKGKILKIVKKTKESQYSIEVDRINIKDVVLGESICINGICLTVISIGSNDFTVEASEETQSKTNLSCLTVGSKVNLERSLKVDGRFGGHIVTGHVDGTGKIESIKAIGDSFEVWVSLPKVLSKYIVEKGSVAVDGVSLTINLVNQNRFSVNIIPYTQKETVFSDYKSGSVVNIECDIIGKYVEKMLKFEKEKLPTSSITKKL